MFVRIHVTHHRTNDVLFTRTVSLSDLATVHELSCGKVGGMHRIRIVGGLESTLRVYRDFKVELLLIGSGGDGIHLKELRRDLYVHGVNEDAGFARLESFSHSGYYGFGSLREATWDTASFEFMAYRVKLEHEEGPMWQLYVAVEFDGLTDHSAGLGVDPYSAEDVVEGL
jgi:hypothetical protein